MDPRQWGSLAAAAAGLTAVVFAIVQAWHALAPLAEAAAALANNP